ncbi:MAG: leucine-rich repeat protein [Lachnospiraceae bacterium]|nr:leucine-rich repeat protein [Lachnospiraceae bacterium]
MSKNRRMLLIILLTAVLVAALTVLILRNNDKRPGENSESASGSASVSADESYAAGEPQFTVVRETEDGVVLGLESAPTSSYKLEIPAFYGDKKVVAFSATEDDKYITEAVVPDGVDVMFSNCVSLKRLWFGRCGADKIDFENIDYVTLEPYPEFTGLPELETVEFADDCGYGQLGGCQNLISLKEIDLPDKILRINTCLVGAGLEKLRLPGELRRLEWSLNNLPHMLYAVCDDKLEVIDTCFNNCPNLQYVIVPSADTEIKNSFVNSLNITLVVGRASKAEEYAKESGFKYAYYDEFDGGLLNSLNEIVSQSGDQSEGNSQAGIYTDDEAFSAMHVTGEEFFSKVRVYDDREYDGIAIAYTGSLKVPFILEVPETYEGEKVGIVYPIENNPYICGVIYHGDIDYIGFISACSNLRFVESESTRGAPVISHCNNLLKEDLASIDYSDSWNYPSQCERYCPDDIPGHLKYITGLDGTAVRELIIPDGVEELSRFAYKCPALERVVLPASLVSAEGCFDDCPNLNELYVYGKKTKGMPPGLVTSDELMIYCIKGSETENYAYMRGMRYSYIEPGEPQATE